MKRKLNTVYHTGTCHLGSIISVCHNQVNSSGKNDTVHGVGFVVLVAAAWLIYRKKAGTEYEEEDQDA